MKDAEQLAQGIKDAVFHGLPGAKAHSKMIPEGRILVSSSQYKESAVLLLLYPKSGTWFTLLMKRNQYQGPHSDQISLPGGKSKIEDKTLLQTAIRETFEEIGLAISKALICASLTPLHIPVSRFVVHPFIAVLDYTPNFIPDRNEVNYLIEVSLQELNDPSAVKMKKMLIREMQTNVPYFDIQGEVIWGATAMILSEFLELISGIIFD